MVQKPKPIERKCGASGLDTAAIIEIVSVFSWVTNTQTNSHSAEGFGLYINPPVTHRGTTRLPQQQHRKGNDENNKIAKGLAIQKNWIKIIPRFQKINWNYTYTYRMVCYIGNIPTFIRLH